MRRQRWLWLLVALAVLVGGCALFGGGKKFVDMSAKEKSVYFMKWYNVQYDDAASMGVLAQQGKLTPGQVEVYRIKRDALVKVKPLIEAYDMVVAGGGLPSAEQEQKILDFINRVASVSGGA